MCCQGLGDSITYNFGKTVLHFEYPLTVDGPQELLWAVGTSNTLTLSGHEPTARGGVSVDLRTATSAKTYSTKKQVALILHGGDYTRTPHHNLRSTGYFLRDCLRVQG